MRRQSRPFVTEYRTPVRRQAGSHQGSAPAEGRVGAGEMGDGRSARVAADDLFRAKPATRDDGAGGHDAAMRAADALFSVRRPEQPATFTEADPDVDTKPASAKGRILQVVEAVAPVEPPVEASVETAPAPVDAEPALAVVPSRRGRKPGSKNKPKLVEAPTAGFDAIEPEHPVAEVMTEHPGEPLAPAVDPLHPRRKRREGYSWMRAKLAPGERWKRRLPRVAW